MGQRQRGQRPRTRQKPSGPRRDQWKCCLKMSQDQDSGWGQLPL